MAQNAGVVIKEAVNMKNASKKTLSTLLAFALVFGLFAAMPLTASAVNTNVTVLESDSIESLQAKIQAAINASGSGDTVTVIGEDLDQVGSTLYLDITTGVTVVWKTGYGCPVSIVCLISLTGNGTFEVAEGGYLAIHDTGNAIISEGDNTVIVNGGTVSTGNGYYAINANNVIVNSGTVSCAGSSVAAIYAEGTNPNITVTGGTVISTAINSHGIRSMGGGAITVSGGTVRADGVHGIAISASASAITVSGGTVSAAGFGISISGLDSTVVVSGGTVTGATSGIYSTNDFGGMYGNSTENPIVTVSGGTVSSVEGSAIYMGGVPGSTVIVSGGTVSSAVSASTFISTILSNSTYVRGTGVVRITGTGCAIRGGYVSIEDGIVEALNTAYAAVDADTIDVSGGVVCATTGWAVDVSGITPTVTVSGGFVFSYGETITGADGVINLRDVGTASIADTAVVCAWNNQIGTLTYDAGSSTDLIIGPSTASAKWGMDGVYSGIRYANGSNSGFFPIDGITVNAANFAFPMENFMLQRTYTPTQFTDVNENMWYGYNGQGAIAKAFEYELMSGNSPTTFNPTGNITIAEAITVATRVHSFYTTGQQVEFTPIPDAPWFQGNVNYAIDNGIIGTGDFTDYRRAATRAEMAYIFSRSIPVSEFASKNTVNSLPDVNSATPYYGAIVMFYKAGVVGGDEGIWTFRPGDNINRAEAAAIITRVILPATRFSGRVYG